MKKLLLALAGFALAVCASAQTTIQVDSGTRILLPLSRPVVWPSSSLRLLDTDSTHSLLLNNGSNLTANRTFTLITGDANRTLTITSDVTLSGDPFTSQTKADVLEAAMFGADAGSTDAYVVTLTPAITAYVPGVGYRFKANTANTGSATVNFNGVGAVALKKAAGGLTTDLATNDIRANQWVDVVYDGVNGSMLVQSGLGNAASGGSGTPGGSPGQVQYNNAGAFGGFTTSGDATINTGTGALTLATVNGNVGSFGSATAVGTFTVNAKGLVTAAGSTTVTPAIGSVTGLGSGVGAALAIDTGLTGAPVLFNGAGGTPTSMVGTNITGAAAGLTAGSVTNATLNAAITVSQATTLNRQSSTGLPVEFYVAASDLTTTLTSGTSQGYFRAPYAFTVTEVRASVLTPQTGGSILTVDINESGTTILSTKLTIDNNEDSSKSAATPPVISDSAIADDAKITIDIDTVGTGAVTGLIVLIMGYR